MEGRIAVTIATAFVIMEIMYIPCTAFGESPEWIVRLHNTYRMFVGVGEGFSVGNMRKLRWDHVLAQEATALASCDKIGESTPEPEYDRLGKPVKGYNKAVGRVTDSALIYIRKWFDQRKHFNSKYHVCNFGKECNKYMQLVSAETHKVGCASNRSCSRNGVMSNVFVCVYSPGVNTADPIFKAGEPCTLCARPASFCEYGLCTDCHPQTHSRCECRKTCMTRHGYGVLSKYSCTCHCIFGHGPNCNEQCRNPEMYLDYDICAEVTEQDCHSDDPDTRAMLEEFCPEQCTCRARPSMNG